MSKSLVGFGHTVDIIFFLDRSAAHVGGIVQLVRQLFRHPFLGAAAGIQKDPADRQADPAVLCNFNRNLVVGSTNTARLDFQQRLRILSSGMVRGI
jgi:hypothetical protein